MLQYNINYCINTQHNKLSSPIYNTFKLQAEHNPHIRCDSVTYALYTFMFNVMPESKDVKMSRYVTGNVFQKKKERKKV
jgi:hypothetical protein